MKIKGDGNIIINSNNVQNKKAKKSRITKLIFLISAIAGILVAINTLVVEFNKNKEASLYKKEKVSVEIRNEKPPK